MFAYAFVSCVYKYTAHMAKAFMASCIKAFIRLLSRLLRVQYFDPIPKLLLRTLNAANMLIYQVSSLDSKGFTTTLWQILNITRERMRGYQRNSLWLWKTPALKPVDCLVLTHLGSRRNIIVSFVSFSWNNKSRDENFYR